MLALLCALWFMCTSINIFSCARTSFVVAAAVHDLLTKESTVDHVCTFSQCARCPSLLHIHFCVRVHLSILDSSRKTDRTSSPWLRRRELRGRVVIKS